MISKFRRRFVTVCMLCVCTVVLVLTVFLSVRETNRAREIVISRLNFLSLINTEHGGYASRMSERFCLINVNPDGDASIQSYPSAAKNESEIVAMALDAYAGGDGMGRIGAYAYKVVGSEVVLLNISVEIAALKSFYQSAALLGISCCVLIFALMLVFSRLATRPIQESILKQRRFITDAGHELKTPVSVIKANVDIIEMNAGANEWTKSIHNQLSRMQRLVENFISLSKLQEEIKIKLEKFSLGDAVYDTAMTFKPLADRNSLTLEVDAADDIYALGVESSARQLVSILLDNAVKYCAEGGAIRVSLVGGRLPVLTVRNSCDTLDKIEFDRLFDRFYRADSARSPTGSHGLGLSIAKAIMDTHRGRISARAENGDFVISARFKGA